MFDPSTLIVIALALLALAALAPLGIAIAGGVSETRFMLLGGLGIVLTASSALVQLKLAAQRPELYERTLLWFREAFNGHGIMWLPNALLVVAIVTAIGVQFSDSRR